jgi:hypothetical protein
MYMLKMNMLLAGAVIFVDGGMRTGWTVDAVQL